MEAEEGSLLARAIQHENDHLDGILFIDHCTNIDETEEILKKYNLGPIETDRILVEEDLEKELENND